MLKKEEGSLGRVRGDVIGMEKDSVKMSKENGLVPKLQGFTHSGEGFIVGRFVASQSD